MKEMPSGIAAKALTVASSLVDSASEFVKTHNIEITTHEANSSSRTLGAGK